MIDFNCVNNNKLFDEMIDILFPDILFLKTIFEINGWHNETTYEHTRNVFVNLNHFFDNSPHINVDQEILYYLAIYHDFGKSSTIIRNSDNTTSFPGHEKTSLSALPQEELIRRLGEKRYVSLRELVEKHSDIHKILDDKENYQNELKEYKRENKSIFLENLIFTLCDIKNSHLTNTNKEEYDLRVSILERCIAEEVSQ